MGGRKPTEKPKIGTKNEWGFLSFSLLATCHNYTFQ